MAGPNNGKADAGAEGDGRKVLTRRRCVTTAVGLVLAAVAAGGGYLLGESSGADLEAARAQGATAGFTRGKTTAGGAYAQGEARGRRVTYGPTFRDAYRKAYLEAFRGTDFDAPTAEQISVPLP